MNKAKGHRAEIDGLRAVAVLPVILFHAGVGLFSGGFLGVDVFFVISGYLITLILYKELEAGRFSILNFYERRARRILPALFVVMLFTLPFAWAWMPPDALRIYIGSLPATAWFMSNVHFFQSEGYFSPDAELQPLLHTWSLAVEEQFYLLFPFLLALLWKVKQRLDVWLPLLATLGFGLCLWQLGNDQNAAFYLPHARVWELLAGAALAVVQSRWGFDQKLPERLRSSMAILSAVLLLTCLMFVDETWSTPGFPNLVVVLATVTLLAFANSKTGVGAVLASPPFVAVGLISYSAYLWHHPLFAFARLGSVNQPPVLLMLGLAMLSLVLAYFSWRWVEQPFRQKGLIQRKTVLSASVVLMLLFGVGGFIADRADVAIAGYTPSQLALVQPKLSKIESCDWKKPIAGNSVFELCELGKSSATGPVILWGDSHAAALRDKLDAVLTESGRGGFFLGNTSCLRIPGIVATARRGKERVAACQSIQTAVFEFLKNAQPSAIVVNMRWTLRLYPVTGARDGVGFNNGEGGVESEDPRVNWAQDANGKWSTDDQPKIEAVVAFLRRLSEIAPVIVIGPVPEVGWHVGDQNFKSLFISRKPPQDITTDFGRFVARNAVALKALDAAEKQLFIRRIEPSEIFCNRLVAGRCVAQMNGTPYYADDDHVSAEGAAMIIREVMVKLPGQSQPKP